MAPLPIHALDSLHDNPTNLPNSTSLPALPITIEFAQYLNVLNTNQTQNMHLCNPGLKPIASNLKQLPHYQLLLHK